MSKIEQKTWQEFQETGLLLYINQVLHVFGWAICIEVFDDNTIKVYPARVKFRGFSESTITNAYIKITDYLSKNIDSLKKDVDIK